MRLIIGGGGGGGSRVIAGIADYCYSHGLFLAPWVVAGLALVLTIEVVGHTLLLASWVASIVLLTLCRCGHSMLLPVSCVIDFVYCYRQSCVVIVIVCCWHLEWLLAPRVVAIARYYSHRA